MNLVELKTMIDNIVSRHRYPEEVQVVIPVFRVGQMGPRSTVPVKNIYLGFDWDDNTLFINPDGDELREINVDEISAIREKYDELCWTQYKISKIKRENEVLKKKLKEHEND